MYRLPSHHARSSGGFSKGGASRVATVKTMKKENVCHSDKTVEWILNK